MQKYIMVAVLGIIALLLSFAPMPVATTVGQETNELGSVNISGKVGGGGIGGMGEVSSVSMSGVASGIEHYVDMGKGLEEPCWPWRECMVFGADLGTPNASDWNCIPEIIGRTNSFDLSTITPNHDVAIALIVFYNVTEELPVTFKWYRNRDNKLIYQSWYTTPEPCEECYVYGYIGYAPEEIWENGNYHLHIIWSPSDFRVLDFEIEGIPPPLERYAPVLYFHPYENYYTDSIDSMLDESDLMLLERPIEFRDLIRNGPIGESELPGSSEFGVYYLDMWNATPAPLWESWRAEKPDPARFTGYPLTVYGRQADKTYEGHNYIVLQYWFFYPYNNWHNCHEGDMERIQIICDKATGDPERVTFGQHRGGETVPWNGGVSLIEGTHPKVFVAQGSHASYPTDGDHPVGPCTDETSNTGLVSFPTGYVNEYDIPTGNKKGYTLTDISSGHPWVEWPGIWGFYVSGSTGGLGQSGPNSPANVVIHKINVWNDPIAWADDPGSPWNIFTGTGPMRAHAYDNNGNHTGLNETGGIETEIPGTYFYIPASNLTNNTELMWIYTEDNLTFTIEASEVGECNFSFARCVEGEITTNYTHVEVIENTTATVNANQTPIPVMQIDHDGDGRVDASKLPDSAGNSTLIGNVSFEGRGEAPNNTWIETFVVRFFNSPSYDELPWSPLYATTNSSGYFTITGLPAGTYDIGIKGKTSLSELVTNVTVGVNESVEVDFGTTREGDIDDSDYVDMDDRDLLYMGWDSTNVIQAGYLCDLDRNGVINMDDRDLMYMWWGETGDLF